MKKPNYKSFCGPEKLYYRGGDKLFLFLKKAGLKSSDSLLDVGCGSLKVGRLVIPYLQPKKYYGIEPERKWLENGIQNEIPKQVLEFKKPKFSYSRHFFLQGFGVRFDVVVAFNVFIHCGTKQLEIFLGNLNKAMSMTGYLLMNIKLGDKTKETPWTDRHCRYPYSSHFETVYDIKNIKKILRKHGFEEKRIWSKPPHNNLLFRIERRQDCVN